MSQSDYIKYKKTVTELKNKTELPYLLEYNSFNLYKGYSLEKSIENTKTKYNQLIPSGRKLIWNMEKNVSNCPTFEMCNNTTSRSNKKTYPANYNVNYCNIKPSRPLSMKKVDILTNNITCKCLPL